MGKEGLRPVDLATLEGVLRVGDVELVLLDGEPPQACIDTRVHDGSLVCSLHLAFHACGRFTLPADWALIGFVHDADPAASWCHGVPLTAGTALTVMADSSSEFAFAAGTRLTLVLLPAARLQRRFAELSLQAASASARVPRLFVAAADGGLAGRYLQLRQLLAHDDAALLAAHDGAALLNEHLQALLATGPADRPVASRARSTHYVVAQRADTFMRLNLRQNVYMGEVCAASGVSERGLRYAFEDLFGLSPNRYLTLLRLCTACRALSEADGGRRSVKAVALGCGFWDLSRFAENYRRVFGELPRQTLMRAPDAPGRRA